MFSILQFFFKRLDFFNVLLFLDRVLFGSGFKRLQVVGNGLQFFFEFVSLGFSQFSAFFGLFDIGFNQNQFAGNFFVP